MKQTVKEKLRHHWSRVDTLKDPLDQRELCTCYQLVDGKLCYPNTGVMSLERTAIEFDIETDLWKDRFISLYDAMRHTDILQRCPNAEEWSESLIIEQRRSFILKPK